MRIIVLSKPALRIGRLATVISAGGFALDDIDPASHIVPKEKVCSGFRTGLFMSNGSPGQTRTADQVVNSHPLYRLSYRGTSKNSQVVNPACSGTLPILPGQDYRGTSKNSQVVNPACSGTLPILPGNAWDYIPLNCGFLAKR